MDKWFEIFAVGKTSRQALFLILLGVLGGYSHSLESAQTQKPEPSVQKIGERFLLALDEAYADRDSLAYGNLLHDELNYQISVSLQGGPSQTMSSSKPLLLQVLPQNWSMVSNYTIERKDIQVRALDKVRLQVKNSYRETMTVQGMDVTNEAEEVITLELNGDMVTAREILREVATTISAGN